MRNKRSKCCQNGRRENVVHTEVIRKILLYEIESDSKFSKIIVASLLRNMEWTTKTIYQLLL